jgi:hypothetical protein
VFRSREGLEVEVSYFSFTRLACCSITHSIAVLARIFLYRCGAFASGGRRGRRHCDGWLKVVDVNDGYRVIALPHHANLRRTSCDEMPVRGKERQMQASARFRCARNDGKIGRLR